MRWLVLLLVLILLSGQIPAVASHSFLDDELNDSSSDYVGILITPAASRLGGATSSQLSSTNKHLLASNQSGELNETSFGDGEDNRFIDGTTIFACNIGFDEIKRLARHGVYLGSSSGYKYMDLLKGNILLYPEENIVVNTQEAKISITYGASVFIMKSSHGLVIYALSEEEPRQVRVTIEKKKLFLRHGHMLAITNDMTQEFEKLPLDCQIIAYRDPELIDLHIDKLKVWTAGFSTFSAFTVVAPLKRLVVSTNKEDQLALDRILSGAGASLLGKFSKPKLNLPREQLPEF